MNLEILSCHRGCSSMFGLCLQRSKFRVVKKLEILLCGKFQNMLGHGGRTSSFITYHRTSIFLMKRKTYKKTLRRLNCFRIKPSLKTQHSEAIQLKSGLYTPDSILTLVKSKSKESLLSWGAQSRGSAFFKVPWALHCSAWMPQAHQCHHGLHSMETHSHHYLGRMKRNDHRSACISLNSIEIQCFHRRQPKTKQHLLTNHFCLKNPKKF